MQKDSQSETPAYGRLTVLFQGSGSAAQIARDFAQQKAEVTAAYGPDWNTLHVNSGSEKQMRENFRRMFGCEPGG